MGIKSEPIIKNVAVDNNTTDLNANGEIQVKSNYRNSGQVLVDESITTLTDKTYAFTSNKYKRIEVFINGIGGTGLSGFYAFNINNLTGTYNARIRSFVNTTTSNINNSLGIFCNYGVKNFQYHHIINILLINGTLMYNSKSAYYSATATDNLDIVMGNRNDVVNFINSITFLTKSLIVDTSSNKIKIIGYLN